MSLLLTFPRPVLLDATAGEQAVAAEFPGEGIVSLAVFRGGKLLELVVVLGLVFVLDLVDVAVRVLLLLAVVGVHVPRLEVLEVVPWRVLDLVTTLEVDPQVEL